MRHVVDNHGGRVDVVSREGDGSTFTLWLPTGGDGRTSLVGVTSVATITDERRDNGHG